MAVRVEPITTTDVPAVARFLHTHLNSRVPAEAWERAVQVPWKVSAPNHGFLLRDDSSGVGEVVGAHLAFYSERTIHGEVRRFCNLGAWCVLPAHRFHSLKLLKALLAQDGHDFTDLSPSGNVVAMNTRLGFSFLDTATAVAPNLPWPAIPGRGRISADPAVLERILTGDDLQIYRDHAETAAARHVVLIRGGRYCYVIFRTDRRRNLPFFASVLYVSDPELFRAMSRRFQSHLLVRHGILAVLAELRVVGARPALSRMLAAPRRKMFRGAGLSEPDIDYLYSELTCLSW
ncbi:hypothetical protein [Actinoplanes couchii]|uniref:N-acetyltransferase domain-containing protein n=1 Tax=Actinoplanes couchii TaxID=403638 RepID=A0ABQ3X6V8_9ACTN|nr:hypothetical protein [Actinoplanes couchii]MDR6322068.1 hypothetical protein [Actinoplanes couchii]GID54232.1 hypothetical protein Aco03nite_026360 [Actinoplanes couchii]